MERFAAGQLWCRHSCIWLFVLLRVVVTAVSFNICLMLFCDFIELFVSGWWEWFRVWAFWATKSLVESVTWRGYNFNLVIKTGTFRLHHSFKNILLCGQLLKVTTVAQTSNVVVILLRFGALMVASHVSEVKLIASRTRCTCLIAHN